MEDPDHVLFMRYEDLKAEPCAQVMRLAEFLGCPFTEEEMHSGYIEEILESCSLHNLSNLDINKTGNCGTIWISIYFSEKGKLVTRRIISLLK